MEASAGAPVTVIQMDAKFAESDKSTPSLGKSCAFVNARVTKIWVI
jgi:hypothetical protein